MEKMKNLFYFHKLCSSSLQLFFTGDVLFSCFELSIPLPTYKYVCCLYSIGSLCLSVDHARGKHLYLYPLYAS